MVTWHEDRLAKFQDLVNLDEITPPPSPETGVVADWRAKMGNLAGWDTTGWELFFQHVRAESGESLGQWGWKRGQEQLALRIFVSSHGILPARYYFRRLAMSSTAPEYPYQKIPYPKDVSKEVVTFFVPSPSPDGQTHSDSVLRLFRNVVFDVRASKARVPVLDVVDDLTDFALQHSNFSLPDNRPKVERTGPQEGKEVYVQVPVAPDAFDDFQATPFEVRVETRGKVEFQGFKQNEANFVWQEQPGEGGIRVQAINRRTLLSRTLSIPE
jgi:hypothetical protein